MLIVEKRNHIVVSVDTHFQAKAISSHFSVPHPQAAILKRRKSYLKEWDGRVQFFKKQKGDNEEGKIFNLPIGFLPKLFAYLKEEEMPYEFTQKAPFEPVEFKQHLDGILLDETQILASKALLARRRAAIELGTGSGKTEIALNNFMCIREAYPGIKMLFVVPKLNLLTQTLKRAHERLPQLKKIGMIGDGEFDVSDTSLVVGTIQTVAALKHIRLAAEIRDWLRTVDLLVLDEAHHSKSFQGQTLVDTCPAYWLWAISAKLTFFDKQNIVKHWVLEGLFGEPAFKGKSEKRTCDTRIVIHRHKSWDGAFADADPPLYTNFQYGLPVKFRFGAEEAWQDGIWRGPDKDGKLSFQRDPDLFKDKSGGRHVPDKETFGIYRKNEDGEWERVKPPGRWTLYWTTHDIGIVCFTPRNHWARGLALECRDQNEPFAVSVRRSPHIFRMQSLLTKAGLKVESVTGKLSGDQQRALFEKVASRAIDGVISTYSILAEGVDIPNLIHLIKLDGITEEQVLHQQRGRVERVYDGKPMGYVHIPRDYQHPSLFRATGRCVTYYKRLNARVITRDYS